MCLLCFISHLLVTEVRGEFLAKAQHRWTWTWLWSSAPEAAWIGVQLQRTLTGHDPQCEIHPVCEACSTINVITVTVTATFHWRVSRALIIRIIESAFVHCSCLLSYFSASMVTVAALISKRGIRERFPLTIMMHLSFTALCAAFSKDFDKKAAWQMDDIRAGVLRGDWNLVSLHNLSQKIIIHVPKQVLE